MCIPMQLIQATVAALPVGHLMRSVASVDGFK
jgi:hypothetical protein